MKQKTHVAVMQSIRFFGPILTLEKLNKVFLGEPHCNKDATQANKSTTDVRETPEPPEITTESLLRIRANNARNKE